MSDLGSITLAPVDPTSPSTVIGSTRLSTTQSGLETTILSLTSVPFVTPAPTLLSTTFFSSLPLTSDLLTQTAVPYPSISAISLSSVSADYSSVTPTSTTEATATSSIVETGALSTETPQDTGFDRQTGVIIGVTIAGTFVLLSIILLIFFACRRYRLKRSYISSMEDISAVPRDTYWRPPLESEDYSAAYGRPISPKYSNTSRSRDGGFFGDHVSGEGGSGSAESGDALLYTPIYRDQPRLPPVSHTPHGSRSYFSNDGRYASQQWCGNTQPLNISKRNKCYNYQPPRLTGDSPIRSTTSSGFGPRPPWNHGPGLLTRDNTKASISGLRPIHLLNNCRHYTTPPTALMLRHDSNLEYNTRRIQQHQEEREQQDRADQNISQIILARLRASRRLSSATTVKAYSQCTTIKSDEEESSSSAPSYLYSPSLLNPPIHMPQIVPRLHLPYDVDHTVNEYREGVGGTSERLPWPGTTMPPTPSPAPTDASSMVEGLLHPRLRTVLAQSQPSPSVASFGDYEDYTRPINGLVNNHIRSTTTFDMQDTGDFGEGN